MNKMSILAKGKKYKQKQTEFLEPKNIIIKLESSLEEK